MYSRECSFNLSPLGKIAAKGVVTNRLCDLLVQPTVARTENRFSVHFRIGPLVDRLLSFPKDLVVMVADGFVGCNCLKIMLAGRESGTFLQPR